MRLVLHIFDRKDPSVVFQWYKMFRCTPDGFIHAIDINWTKSRSISKRVSGYMNDLHGGFKSYLRYWSVHLHES